MWHRWALMAMIWASSAAQAEVITFFGGNIDFWGKPPPPAQQEVAAKQPSPFPWALYLDPSNKEFFREGDYTPPEPFMEVARNPSDQNLAMWFSYLERKNAVAARLESRLQEFAARANPVAAAEVPSVTLAASGSPVLAGDYVIRFFFDPSCPHCRKMFQTVTALQNSGFQVEGRQVAGSLLPATSQPFPIRMAAPDELKRQGIDSVPQLLIAQVRTGKVFRLRGFMTEAEVQRELQGK